jgi:hypothetical protein
MGDWQAGVLSRTDFPETNLQIAGAAMTLRNLPAALAALGEAVTLDPQLEAGWVAIIRILAATGDTARAQAALTAALAAIPASPTLLAVASDLGLSTP